jgi:signal transduction histidine kinase
MTNDDQLLLHTSSGNKRFVIKSPVPVNTLFYNNKYLYAASGKKLFIAPLPETDNATIRFRLIHSLPDSTYFGGRFVSDPNGNTILFEHRNICVYQNDSLLFRYPINPYDLIEGMYVNHNKQLWVVSRGTGLHVFSLHPETPSSYLQKEQHFLKEFENASPRRITVDKNELLWVGTRFDGLIAFEYKNNQLKKRYHFQTHTGLTDNFVTALACDGDNNIIIGTQTGVDRLIKTNDGYRLENVTKSNNTFAYIDYVWTDARNNAFALTNAGAVLQIEPVQSGKILAEPQLLIEEIKVNGQTITHFKTGLHLQHFQRNITFSVAAPSFIDEKQIKYSYLLSGGGNKGWSDTTTLADINLLNLSPGNYTLHVKAFFPSTAYSAKETEFSFSILPPWWQTWWFRFIAGLLITGLLISAARAYYRRKLEKQKALLEKQQAIEKERTRIATDMHDDLGAGLSTIRFLSEKVKRNSFSDVTRDDAEKIVTNSNDLVQKMNEIIWAMNEKNDTLEDLLFYTRSYSVEYCEENNLSCETHLPEKIPAVFVSGEIRRNVFLTVKESLHNIVKHAHAEKVIIDFIVNTSLVITVKDDGTGFPANTKGSGNGLRNMQKRVELINGTFETTDNNGIQVKIVIPLGL